MSERHHYSKQSFRRELVPSLRDVLERELGPLRPAGSGRATANCPFHKSKSGKSFSVDLAKGRWYCHGCGFGGDAIKFVMLLYRCDFVTAAKQLGAWGDISPEERTEIVRREQEREWNRQREAERTQADRRERLQLRNELHTTVRIYRDLDNHLHRVGPVGTEAEGCWSTLPSVLNCLRFEESAYCRAARLEDPWGLA